MKLLKKIIPVLFVCLFIFAIGASAKTLQLTIGDPFITVKDLKGIDTNKIDAAPFISNGRTLVPVRVIAESFGSKVGWDDATRTVTLTAGTKSIKLVIGSNVATVNGQSVKLDVPADIYGERTYVPIRFVTETLGYNVAYVDMTKDVVISDLPAIMDINGTKVTIDTYNLIKYFDKYDFTGKTSAELVEYSKDVYNRIETAYRKYSYVFAKGETISEAKKKEINEKMFNDFDDEDVLNNIVPGVYMSWQEKLAYAEIYDEKYAPEKQVPVYDETLVANSYNEKYYAVDYIKIGEKNQENLAKIIEIEQSIAADGWDAVEASLAEDAACSIVKGSLMAKEDYSNILFDTTVDLELNMVSEAVILEDGYYIARKVALPEISPEIKEELITHLADSAVKEVEDQLASIPCQYLVTSNDALDLAE